MSSSELSFFILKKAVAGAALYAARMTAIVCLSDDATEKRRIRSRQSLNPHHRSEFTADLDRRTLIVTCRRAARLWITPFIRQQKSSTARAPRRDGPTHTDVPA